MIMMMIIMRIIMMVSVNKLDDNQQLRLSKTEVVIPTISRIANINNIFIVITRTEGESSQCIDNGTKPS